MDNPIFDHSAIIRRPRLELPDGARVAFWVGLNVEHYQFGQPALSMAQFTAEMVPDPLNYGWRDYGMRVGLWRVADILARHEVTPSILLNSEVCTRYPEVIEEGNRRGWCWVGHGRDNSTLQSLMDEDSERTYLAEVVGTIERHCGVRPSGWLSPVLQSSLRTHELLAELGLTYTLDWTNDDQPYDLNVKSGRFLSVPYASEVNDIPMFCFRNQDGAAFQQAMIDQFDQLYADGAESARVMGIGIHPFLIGQPYQARYLDAALEHIAGRDDVWVTTSDEVARWYLEATPNR